MVLNGDQINKSLPYYLTAQDKAVLEMPTISSATMTTNFRKTYCKGMVGKDSRSIGLKAAPVALSGE
jgi:hypothetical protein